MTIAMKNLAITGALAALLVACGDAETATEAPAAEALVTDASLQSSTSRLPAVAATTDLTLSSPDGTNTLSFGGNVFGEAGGTLTYTLARNGRTAVDTSRLGLRFAEAAGMDDQLRLVGTSRASRDETWEQPWGEMRMVRDHHNELALDLANAAGARFTVRARCFDEGCAFRYEVPDQAALPGTLTVTDEITQFTLDPAALSWTIPAREWNRYEYLYTKQAVDALKRVHTPATFRLPGGTVAVIHEAALVDYSGMSLEKLRDGILEADLAPRADGRGRAVVELPMRTPWRTIHLASRDADLLDDVMELNLNAPNALPEFDFTPGKYAGIWWEQHMREGTWGNTDGEVNHHAATTAATKAKMDFAAENGFVGVLVEGWNTGWDGDWFNNGDVFSFTETYDDFDIAEVAAHGRKVGTRLIGHHETSGNLTNYENQLDDALDLMAEHDVQVIKTGYVADAGDLKIVGEDGVARYGFHDGQEAVDHHLLVVREAAERGIAINAHEPVKDTGLRRTYPNWVSREGARGQEFNAWGIPPNGPDHVPNLMFTRMISGPMDYTAGAFDLRPSERPPVADDLPRNDPASRIEHTLAKELALFVAIYSPVQMVMDLTENYEARPDAFQFIKDVPTDWERTVPLAGRIGEFAVVARQERGGPDWYLGAVTDDRARTVDVDLRFLGEGEYEAQIYRDGANADYESDPYDLVIETRTVTADDTLAIAMKRSGGAAIRFRKL